MRIVTEGLEVTIDLIQTTEEIGELCKLATKLGYHAVIESALDEDGDPRGEYQVRMVRPREVWGQEEFISLAILYAFVNGLSGDQLLEQLRTTLQRREFPLDRPIQDVMQIGGGPNHHGHNPE